MADKIGFGGMLRGQKRPWFVRDKDELTLMPYCCDLRWSA